MPAELAHDIEQLVHVLTMVVEVLVVMDGERKAFLFEGLKGLIDSFHKCLASRTNVGLILFAGLVVGRFHVLVSHLFLVDGEDVESVLDFHVRSFVEVVRPLVRPLHQSLGPYKGSE